MRSKEEIEEAVRLLRAAIARAKEQQRGTCGLCPACFWHTLVVATMIGSLEALLYILGGDSDNVVGRIFVQIREDEAMDASIAGLFERSGLGEKE